MSIPLVFEQSLFLFYFEIPGRANVGELFFDIIETDSPLYYAARKYLYERTEYFPNIESKWKL